MSNCFVTLVEILKERAGPLGEDEIWALLQQATESSPFRPTGLYIICPWSMLLSSTGALSFRSNLSGAEIYTFTAPEVLQGRGSNSQLGTPEMHVYSLGMTLYWAADYQLLESQPIQLSDLLNQLLLSMCEDLAHKRVPLETILDICKTHQQSSGLPPADMHLRRLVKEVLGSKAEVGKHSCLLPCSTFISIQLVGSWQNPVQLNYLQSGWLPIPIVSVHWTLFIKISVMNFSLSFTATQLKPQTHFSARDFFNIEIDSQQTAMSHLPFFLKKGGCQR
uniref:KIND domain-containing protein n=1 Tax=Callorhinchus milii TaxID=7868 RepID=A0A4W3GXM3_CALMI